MKYANFRFLLTLLFALGCLGSCTNTESNTKTPPEPVSDQEKPTETSFPRPLRFDFAHKGNVIRVDGKVTGRAAKGYPCLSMVRTDTAFTIVTEGDNDFVKLAAAACSKVEYGKVGIAAVVGNGMQDGSWEMNFEGEEAPTPYTIEAVDPGKHSSHVSYPWAMAARPVPALDIEGGENGLVIAVAGSEETMEIPLKGDSVTLGIAHWENKNGVSGNALVNLEKGTIICILEEALPASSFGPDFPMKDIQNAILKEQKANRKAMKAAHGKKWKGESFFEKDEGGLVRIGGIVAPIKIAGGLQVIQTVKGEVVENRSLDEVVVRLTWRPGELELWQEMTIRS